MYFLLLILSSTDRLLYFYPFLLRPTFVGITFILLNSLLLFSCPF
jgi:hypothetical protein